MNWLQENIDNYYNWLKEKTAIREDRQTGWTAISTPFLGLFNDPVEIYAKLENQQLILSDDGETIGNLKLVGVSVSGSPKRKELLDKILLNYGIQLDGDELLTKGNPKDFNQKKHNLISAICEIAEMEMLAKHTVHSVFKEDVRAFLDEQKITYTPQFIAKGNTGIDFTFDFQLAGREKEIVIKSFNSLTKTDISSFLFSWEDIKENRQRISGKQLQGLAIINDTDKKVSQEYTAALEIKKTDYILWNERHEPSQMKKLVA